MKPFLKWVGGKTQIIDEVIKHFPKEIENYHEPFLGGGSVLLALLDSVKRGDIYVSGTVYASDINSNLIGLYRTIQSNPDALIQEVRILVDEFSRCSGNEINRNPITIEDAMTSSESYYYWVRSRFNSLSLEEKTMPKGSAMMVFLNKTCFRGMYREGPRGFNVPFGNYKHPTILDEDHIRNVSHLIQNVVFTTQSFAESLNDVAQGDFVYLDPPYVPESATSFVKYTADGFDMHMQLFQLCKELPCRFLLSNANVSLVKDAFPSPNYKTKIISCRRAINSKNPESKTLEVLITNQEET